MIELKETVDMMISNDYKERFIAEYQQTQTRYLKLRKFCDRIEAAELCDTVEMPKHDCPLSILREQQKHMGMYLHTLEVRAIIEGIDLHIYA